MKFIIASAGEGTRLAAATDMPEIVREGDHYTITFNTAADLHAFAQKIRCDLIVRAALNGDYEEPTITLYDAYDP